MITSLLIANRGEIACRIIRTCRRLGVRAVAVHSTVDRDALHVREADAAFCIGAASPGASYLSIPALIAAARAAGVEAVHPGYGFLSENADFAEACAAAGLIFIGPSPQAIRLMGSKAAAKALMADANVPVVPGWQGAAQDDASLEAAAHALGFPLMIKALAGGGGRGMREVADASGFLAALNACRREAASAFGDDKVLLERLITRPRHIEVQVFGDSHGEVVHLFERDCSLQRRHQKLVEEAPAPGLSGSEREAMALAACAAARAVNYVGAGTVEFIRESDGRFYFMEMNTRLQVEHPVTEMITGLDLVEWQIRIASGEALPRRQADIACTGHAFEFRLCAEDPARGFLPSSGRFSLFDAPAPDAGLRLDSGFAAGDQLPPDYDSMFAKLIVHGATRDEALARARTALSACHISGPATNISFLYALADVPEFRQGGYDTGLFARLGDSLTGAALPDQAPALAAMVVLLAEAAESGAQGSPWALRDGWRLGPPVARTLSFAGQGRTVTMAATPCGDGVWQLAGAGGSWRATGHRRDAHHAAIEINGTQFHVAFTREAATLRLFFDGHDLRFESLARLRWQDDEASAHGSLLAPMPGRIMAQPVEIGAEVEAGTVLVIMEAMKMEHHLRSPHAGTLTALAGAVGDQVEQGRELARVAPRAR
ncbi:MAG: acetyl-CoA carboxylase biotin carboxylase subunit [Hyphomicrobiales bacterium]|nr:acetyl-CoA carboxylase biotin carboxylase subunit [Hyphomicrobiales bacterium]